MYVSVDFSQIKKEETKILKMIQNAKEGRKIGIRKKLVYEVILQPIQGEDRAHDKDGP